MMDKALFPIAVYTRNYRLRIHEQTQLRDQIVSPRKIFMEIQIALVMKRKTKYPRVTLLNHLMDINRILTSFLFRRQCFCNVLKVLCKFRDFSLLLSKWSLHRSKTVSRIG